MSPKLSYSTQVKLSLIREYLYFQSKESLILIKLRELKNKIKYIYSFYLVMDPKNLSSGVNIVCKYNKKIYIIFIL